VTGDRENILGSDLGLSYFLIVATKSEIDKLIKRPFI
jgi:hypothetical protein